MRDNGFIKLSRKFFTNDIWKEGLLAHAKRGCILYKQHDLMRSPLHGVSEVVRLLGKEGNIRHLYVSYQKNGIGVKNELEYSLID